jgi:hypothetical protein
MNLRFLCARHRAWLEQDPRAAQTVWLRAYDTARNLRAEGESERALRHAGAAVEAAVVALSRDGARETRSLDRFTDSCVLFLANLRELRQDRTARTFLGAAVQHLSDMMAAGAPRGEVMLACQRLLAANESDGHDRGSAAGPAPRGYHLH